MRVLCKILLPTLLLSLNFERPPRQPAPPRGALQHAAAHAQLGRGGLGRQVEPREVARGRVGASQHREQNVEARAFARGEIHAGSSLHVYTKTLAPRYTASMAASETTRLTREVSKVLLYPFVLKALVNEQSPLEANAQIYITEAIKHLEEGHAVFRGVEAYHNNETKVSKASLALHVLNEVKDSGKVSSEAKNIIQKLITDKDTLHLYMKEYARIKAKHNSSININQVDKDTKNTIKAYLSIDVNDRLDSPILQAIDIKTHG